MKKRNGMSLLPLVYAIFGIYLLNYTFGFMAVPKFLSSVDSWIVGFSGVLLLVSAYRMVVYSKKRILKRALGRSS